MSDKEVLKEVIHQILVEYSGETEGDMGGMNAPGVSDQFFTDIFNAFVDPLKTTAAFVSNFSSEVQKLAGKISEDVMATFLPGYEQDYEQYEKEHEERQKAIYEKYKKVFARTDAHLFTGDAALMGFLYAPHKYVTSRILKKSPDAALYMLDTISGNNASVKQFTDNARKYTKSLSHLGRMRGGPTSPNPLPIDGIAQPKVKVKWYNPQTSKQRDPTKTLYKQSHTKSTKSESVQRINEGFFDKLAGMFKDNKIEQAVEQSPIAQKMRQDAEEYVKNYVQGVVEMTQEKISQLKSTDTLDQATGGKFSQLIDSQGLDDTKKVAQLVVGSTKKGIKALAAQDLKQKAEEMSKTAPSLAKIYQAGIKQIQSL